MGIAVGMSSILATLVLCVSLVYVGRQTAALRAQSSSLDHSLRLQAEAEIQNRFFAINEEFSRHPEVRRALYPDEDHLDDSELRARAVAEMLADTLEMVLTSPAQVAATADHWQTYSRELFQLSGVLRGYVRERRRWYDAALVGIADAAEEEVRQHQRGQQG
jgi:hypothetical protein